MFLHSGEQLWRVTLLLQQVVSLQISFQRQHKANHGFIAHFYPLSKLAKVKSVSDESSPAVLTSTHASRTGR